MIEFLIDHTTREPKPQVFEAGDRPKNMSGDTEAFYVRLGVAAFVEDGQLVGHDGQRIDADASLAREVALTIDAPQRASTGPGNAVLFGDADTLRAENGRLTELLASSDTTLAQLHDEYGRKLDTLTADHAKALDAAIAERDAALKRAEAAEARTADTTALDAMRGERDAAVKRAEAAEELAKAGAGAEPAKTKK